MPDDSVLIVSATRAEAHYVPTGSRLLITGIGKVRATMALARELTLGAPVAQIINIGTAGALHDHHAGLFVPSTVVEHDISATELRTMGYDMVDVWELPDGDGSVLASGDTFVADSARRAQLARRADLVDMEGAAVAHVSSEFGVACRLVKVVSDSADEGAMEWPALVDAAARRLGDWLSENLG
ncbi:nucleosidase [Gordonia sp. ABSL1-1]|uniref:nucleosidase n=1 Tax=Gordonia sp. ABSL1-1 TaxID=3053923 RepID=UPI0025745E29|nr:nucleosidase [Gordonia sp. ABSL1-1]MDL9935761.1 nucleosidase [Gordonia sp. ABSL1-1]